MHPPRRISRRRAVQVLTGALALGGTVNGRPADVDTIDLSTEHQEIDNFGASDCWSMQRVGLWSGPARGRVADLLFSTTKGIGLSCWRFNAGGGINPRITNPWRTAETFEVGEGRYDWSRQAGERWFLEAAKARGVPRFLAFVNSPPGRMTRNGLTFCGNEGTTNLKPGFEGQFARYLGDILDHFRTLPDERQRIAFDYVSPVNEPQWDWTGRSQEGMRASNADIKLILRSLSAELERRRIPTQLAAAESGSLPDMWQLNRKATERWGAPYGNYLEELAADPAVAPALSRRIGFHDYGSDRLAGQLVEHRATLGQKMKSYPGWKIWQTEYCVMTGSQGKGGNGRDLTMDTALDVARIIHLDLTLVGVSAWQWWTAFSPVNYKDGLIYTNWRKPGDEESVFPARLLWVLGNYSRFVRPGMRRVALSGAAHDVRGLMGSAYKDDRSRTVAAVYVNMGAEPRAVRLQFARARWRPKSITPYITSDAPGDELRPGPRRAASEPVEIPPRSVVTLVLR